MEGLFFCHFVCLGLFCFVFIFETGSLGNPGCTVTHYVASFELTDPSVPASQVLGLKACTTMPGSTLVSPTGFHIGLEFAK